MPASKFQTQYSPHFNLDFNYNQEILVPELKMPERSILEHQNNFYGSNFTPSPTTSFDTSWSYLTGAHNVQDTTSKSFEMDSAREDVLDSIDCKSPFSPMRWDISWMDQPDLLPVVEQMPSLSGPGLESDLIRGKAVNLDEIGRRVICSAIPSQQTNEPPPLVPVLSNPTKKLGRNTTQQTQHFKIEHSVNHEVSVKNEHPHDSATQSTRSPPKVRSAKRTKTRIPSNSKKLATPQTSLDGRASHNLVEKQYRNRLNDQITNLLASIPDQVIDAEIKAPGEEGRTRRISKAEVLLLAKKHIETLESENKSLNDKVEDLEGNVRRLKEAWGTRARRLPQ